MIPLSSPHPSFPEPDVARPKKYFSRKKIRRGKVILFYSLLWEMRVGVSKKTLFFPSRLTPSFFPSLSPRPYTIQRPRFDTALKDGSPQKGGRVRKEALEDDGKKGFCPLPPNAISQQIRRGLFPPCIIVEKNSPPLERGGKKFAIASESFLLVRKGKYLSQGCGKTSRSKKKEWKGLSWGLACIQTLFFVREGTAQKRLFIHIIYPHLANLGWSLGSFWDGGQSFLVQGAKGFFLSWQPSCVDALEPFSHPESVCILSPFSLFSLSSAHCIHEGALLWLGGGDGGGDDDVRHRIYQTFLHKNIKSVCRQTA